MDQEAIANATTKAVKKVIYSESELPTYIFWVTHVLFWVLIPSELNFLRRLKLSFSKWKSVSIAQLILSIFMLLLNAINISIRNFSRYNIYESSANIVSMILLIIILMSYSQRGVRNSMLVSIFWIFLSLSSVLKNFHELQFNFDGYILAVMLGIPFFLQIFFSPEYDNYAERGAKSPEKVSNFVRKILFEWFALMIWRNQNTFLTEDRVWGITKDLRCQPNTYKIERHISKKSKSQNQGYDDVKTSEHPTVNISIYNLIVPFMMDFLIAGFWRLILVFLFFTCTYLLRKLLNFKSSGEPLYYGDIYAFALLMVSLGIALSSTQYTHLTSKIGLKIRSALTNMIYKKATRIYNVSNVGEIVNLITNDCKKFIELLPEIHNMWSGPVVIIAAIVFLALILGIWPMLAGLMVILFLIPLNMLIGNKLLNLQYEQMHLKDARIKLTNEVFDGIKLLKLYGWENGFEQQILDIRNRELKVMRTTMYYNALKFLTLHIAPFFISSLSFIVFVCIEGKETLTVDKIFVSISLFFILKAPLTAFPTLITNIVESKVALQRINHFIKNSEMQTNAVYNVISPDTAINVQNGQFARASDEIILKNINISIKKGSLTAIVGPVGSGKSSLIAAFLGEMVKKGGDVYIDGTIAFVNQEAWIQNTTIESNILFGSKMDEARFRTIISGCDLNTDIDALPKDTQTLVGEKGVTLSGGQKQRISLARAIYSSADIYLLDDPTSAVDVRVAGHIFNHILGKNGFLCDKTRIVVTNDTAQLREFDNILVFQNGVITEQGSYNELLEKKGYFAEFLTIHASESKQFAKTESIVKSRSFTKEEIAKSEKTTAAGTTDDTMPTGRLRKFVDYMKVLGIPTIIISFVVIVLSQVFAMFANYWISSWASKPATDKTKDYQHLLTYVGLGFAQAICLLINSIMLTHQGLHAAKILHNNILSQLIRRPMVFFDSTPIGRIINRLTQDLHVVDKILSISVRDWMAAFSSVIFVFILFFCTLRTANILVYFTLLASLVYYFFLLKYYLGTSRQLQIMDASSYSPIISHLTETLQGITTVRAYKQEKRFITDFVDKIDYNMKFAYNFQVGNRWLGVRLEIIGSFIVFIVTLFILVQGDPILVGLTISYALQMIPYLNALVRTTAAVEANSVAVERIKDYSIVKKSDDLAEVATNSENTKFITAGKIVFKDYVMGYTEDVNVLKNINIKIEPNDKVGLIGRTGAGKTSLILSLFRIVEPRSGKIIIDGTDISSMNLQDLRTNLTIIPQDPVLFSGTLRNNLDPLNEHSDQEIWEALDSCELKTFVQESGHWLNFKILERGDNLSSGQKQLICLARALLRKTKVFIFDEATGSIDMETDRKIQKIIASKFNDSTVLTIAHRLQTVESCDKILILVNGEVVEYDTKKNLMSNMNSAYHKMRNEIGMSDD